MRDNTYSSIGTICFVLAFSTASTVTFARGGLPSPATDRDFYDNGAPPAAKVELGKFLFFDKLLSGNKNIACATCHHALTDTGDGLSLPIGEGGRGLGVARDTGSGRDAVVERVPRNAPAVFNLGAVTMDKLFHDGRVQLDPAQPTGFDSPAKGDLPAGLYNVLAVQAMFPVSSATEMAGQPGENRIANAVARGDLAGPNGVWALLAKRLRQVPEYVKLFRNAYPQDIRSRADISYVHAANAIAAFEAVAWRADNSPFDRYLRGDRRAMSPKAVRGMKLFYGKAGCASCHTGPFQSDMLFYAIAMPQIGPGKGDNVDGYFDGHDDFGRERVTENPTDRMRFRTPPLRNVALTAPYGHSGAYDTLEAVILHHLNPVEAIYRYDTSQATLPSRRDLDRLDFAVMNDPVRAGYIADANELAPLRHNDAMVADLVAFMYALTDPASIDIRGDVPDHLPSGLPLAD